MPIKKDVTVSAGAPEGRRGLHTLNLSHNTFGSDGIEAFCMKYSPKRSSLRVFNLSYCMIDCGSSLAWMLSDSQWT